MVVKGSLQQLLLSSDIDRLVGLGGLPLRATSRLTALGTEGGAQRALRAAGEGTAVKVVIGPGTFVNEAAEQIDEQLDHPDQAGRSAGRGGPSGSLPRRR